MNYTQHKMFTIFILNLLLYLSPYSSAEGLHADAQILITHSTVSSYISIPHSFECLKMPQEGLDVISTLKSICMALFDFTPFAAKIFTKVDENLST